MSLSLVKTWLTRFWPCHCKQPRECLIDTLCGKYWLDDHWLGSLGKQFCRHIHIKTVLSDVMSSQNSSFGVKSVHSLPFFTPTDGIFDVILCKA